MEDKQMEETWEDLKKSCPICKAGGDSEHCLKHFQKEFNKLTEQ